MPLGPVRGSREALTCYRFSRSCSRSPKHGCDIRVGSRPKRWRGARHSDAQIVWKGVDGPADIFGELAPPGERIRRHPLAAMPAFDRPELPALCVLPGSSRQPTDRSRSPGPGTSVTTSHQARTPDPASRGPPGISRVRTDIRRPSGLCPGQGDVLGASRSQLLGGSGCWSPRPGRPQARTVRSSQQHRAASVRQPASLEPYLVPGWCRVFSGAFSRTSSCSPGPLAHRVEQGTFNPKVPGSSPGRPTSSEAVSASVTPSG